MMKLKIVTLTTELNHPGLLQFKRSLDYFGFDYHIIHQDAPSGAHIFGTQMPLVYDWAKNHSGDYTHMIYCDAWDSFMLGSMEEVLEKLCNMGDYAFIGSAEKACFPNPDLAKEYPETKYSWKYLNAGGWFANISFFCKMYEDNPAVGVNDQLWLAMQFLKFLKEGYSVTLDFDCRIFQTIAFEHNGDFAVLPPVQHSQYLPDVEKPKSSRNGKYRSPVNLQTKQLPIIFHGNGRTPMDLIWGLLPEPTL